MKRREQRKLSATGLSIGLLRGSSIKYALATGEPRQFWDLQITERHAAWQGLGSLTPSPVGAGMVLR
jgi:hypothetical protein